MVVFPLVVDPLVVDPLVVDPLVVDRLAVSAWIEPARPGTTIKATNKGV